MTIRASAQHGSMIGGHRGYVASHRDAVAHGSSWDKWPEASVVAARSGRSTRPPTRAPIRILRVPDLGPSRPSYLLHSGRPSRWPALVVAAALVLARGRRRGGVSALSGGGATGSFAVAEVAAGPGTGPGLSAPREIVPTVPGYVSELRGLTDGAVAADGQR